MHTGVRRIGFVLAALAGGCTVGPNYRTPATSAPEDWSGRAPGATATQPTSTPASQPTDLAVWWETLHDPLLDELMLRAVDSNLNLRVATARVREARASRNVAAAPLWPFFNASSGYTYEGRSQNTGSSSGSSGGRRFGLPTVTAQPGANGNPPTIAVNPAAIGPFQVGGSRAPGITISPGRFDTTNGATLPTISVSPPGSTKTATVSPQLNLFQAGFDATWELDVFGGIRRSVEAADADVAAAVESRRDVLVTLLSEVAANYVQLRGSQRRLQIAYENIISQQDTVELTRARYEAGFTSELDVTQAQAQLATTQSQVPLLQSAIRQSIYQLSVLLALTPDALVAELEKAEPIPTTPPDLPLGLPSDLLRRRPDIRTAERQLAGATARIGVATADLFPRFSLTGSFGSQTSDMRHFLDGRSLFWSVGPAVSWPIFQGGAIVANIEVQNARQEQALATYQQTVLSAFQDVESALVAYTNEKARHGILTDAVKSDRRAYELSNELYSRGLTAFLNVLDSQRALYLAEDELIQSETTAVTNLISLYKALGGGWEGTE